MSERKEPKTAKERKPLIERGSVLGERPDIMSAVLNGYAERTGQEAPFQPETPPDSETLRHQDDQTSRRLDTETPGHQDIPASETNDVETSGHPDSQLTGHQDSHPDTKTSRHQPETKRKPSRKADPIAEARADVTARAATPKRLCSYRIPEGLDDWLEEYVFEHRRSGLKKLDLIAEAIGLLIVSKAAPELTPDRRDRKAED